MTPHAPHGDVSLANASSSFRPSLARSRELMLLLAAGAVAALLHASFRWPLQMPGHHGLEWLAILTAARLLSQRPGAALAVALGAAGTTLAVSGHENLLRPLIYLLQGAALDGLWLLLQAEFLAIALIVVYVGAVMVLFLFVVMMLDINLERLRQGFWNNLWLVRHAEDGRDLLQQAERRMGQLGCWL